MLRFAAVMSVALALVVGSLVQAADKGVTVGDKAPAFSGLKGTDGKEYSLAGMKDSKVVVVVFSCNTCPKILEREDKFTGFAKDYAGKGVKMIAINTNGGAANTLDEMKTRADKKGFTFVYAADADQSVGRAYGARVTPHCFVIKDGVVEYVGAFDDGEGKEFVKDACDALLAGKKPAVTKTEAFGCGISYRSKG